MQKAERLGSDLGKIFERFPEIERKLEGYWLANFANSNKAVANVIKMADNADSEFAAELAKSVYGEGHPPIAKLGELTYEDLPSMTSYGRMLAMIRFCAGYYGNMQQGEPLLSEHALAMAFAYDAYWAHGGDVMIARVMDDFLREVASPEECEWPTGRRFEAAEKSRQLQLLGLEIARELQALVRFYRQSRPGMAAWRTEIPTKPSQRDFRAIHTQILEADRALSKAKRTPVKK